MRFSQNLQVPIKKKACIAVVEPSAILTFCFNIFADLNQNWRLVAYMCQSF